MGQSVGSRPQGGLGTWALVCPGSRVGTRVIAKSPESSWGKAWAETLAAHLGGQR